MTPDELYQRMKTEFFCICGPCVIESEAHALMVARELAAIAERTGVLLVYKSSFDKANRTSLGSCRGPGIEEGLWILDRVRTDTGLPTCTDIHEPWQAPAAGDAVDVVQIPAFLCRQTDLLTAAATTGVVVNVKKGQFVAPSEMAHVAEKVRQAGNPRVLLTERGFAFGHKDLVVDMRGIARMRDFGAPVVFDATHSCQEPGTGVGVTGGNPRWAYPLARAAVAAGADGLFFEVHQAPERAPSDGAVMVRLDGFERQLRQLKVLADWARAEREAGGET